MSTILSLQVLESATDVDAPEWSTISNHCGKTLF